MIRRAPRPVDDASPTRGVTVSVSPTIAVVCGLLILEALVVLAMQLTHAVRVRSFVVVVLLALVMFCALIFASGGFIRNRVRMIRPAAGEIALFVGAAVMFAFVLSRAAGGSGWSPPTHTVDVAHHGSIVAWITEHRDYPRTYVAQLDSFSRYPNATHIVAAVFGWMSRCPPLTSMWLLALSWFASIWLLCGVIVQRVTRSWAASLVPLVLAVVAWHYTIGLLTYDFFFSQLGGLAFAVAAVALVVCGAAGGLAVRLWLPATVVLAAAATLAYPQHLVIVPAALLGYAAVSLGWVRRLSRRSVAIGAGLVTVLALVTMVIGRQIDFGKRTLTGEGEGTVTAPSLRTFGGLLPIVLAANGIVELVGSRLRRTRNKGGAALIGAALGPLLLSGLFWLLQHGVPVKIAIFNYRLYKNFYSAMPFVLCVAAIGVSVALGSTRRRAAFGLVASCITGVALLLGPTLRYSSRHPILSKDGYALGRWAGEHYDANDIGIVAPGIEPYFLWRVALRRPIDRNRLPEVKPTYRWVDWPAKEPERYLLADGPSANTYADRPGVRVVRRRGTAVLLERQQP